MRRALVLLAALLFAGAAFAQPAQLAPCLVAGTDCSSGGGSGTVTTTGSPASGQVALVSGATSITGDSGCTWTGTGASFALTVGILSAGSGSVAAGYTAASGDYGLHLASAAKLGFSSTLSAGGTPNLALSRPSAGTLLVEDGSGAARDVQARTGTFGTSVVTPVLVSGPGKSGTNVAGTNNTIQAEPGTGSATGSSIIFQTPSATGSGTTAQTQTTRLTLSEPAVIAAVPVRLAGYTVATLPSGTVGDTAYVTDATAPTYNGALTGGGAVVIPVFYNGAAWVSH